MVESSTATSVHDNTESDAASSSEALDAHEAENAPSCREPSGDVRTTDALYLE